MTPEERKSLFYLLQKRQNDLDVCRRLNGEENAITIAFLVMEIDLIRRAIVQDDIDEIYAVTNGYNEEI